MNGGWAAARVLPAETWVIAAGAALAWLTDARPAALPCLAPWDFSGTTFLAIGFVLVWFLRGNRADEALPRWRSIFFLVGLAGVYAVTLTRFEYSAQHMFFLNRVQHAILHHMGPFLMALAWPIEAIAAGMPAWLRRRMACRPITGLLRASQHPVVAVLLFEGLLILWVIPPVNFRAMLNPFLYQVMSDSMAIDGVLFWFLVLDPRPHAPVSFFTRLVLAFVIIFPQIIVGTLIGLARFDLYPSFDLCGRVLPALDALGDQQIGGLILWVPTGMMSAIAAVVIMQRMFRHEDRLVGAMS